METNFRLFAFWDKEDNQQTLVIMTHGIIKETKKVLEKEIEKAEQNTSNNYNLKFLTK